MESVPSLLPKGLSYILYKDKNQGRCTYLFYIFKGSLYLKF